MITGSVLHMARPLSGSRDRDLSRSRDDSSSEMEEDKDGASAISEWALISLSLNAADSTCEAAPVRGGESNSGGLGGYCA